MSVKNQADELDEASCIEQAQEVESALRESRFDDVLASADAAISELLHDGLSVEEFIRLALRGAALESLMRVERRAVMRFRHLHEPLALRWEALRRSGRSAEAKQMRLLCIRHFPERASVWATAGNQALDEQQFEEAEACFQRCLKCNPQWTAGLAGLAIVLETRKDWQQALGYRKRVVEVTHALEHDDPPSLQRVVRYAAALCRVGGLGEAEVLFRRCIALGAYERLPAERPVLLRVFSREFYSPAIIAMFSLHGELPLSTPEITLAVQEAETIARAMRAIDASSDMNEATRHKWGGMCAWLAGDAARAYAWLDDAEVHLPNDIAIHCLLAWSARQLGAQELESIERFALLCARGYLERAEAAEVAHEDIFYATITLARLSGEDAAPLAVAAARAYLGTEDAPVLRALHGSWRSQLQQLIAYRVALRAAGRSALEVALASADAIAALRLSCQPF